MTSFKILALLALFFFAVSTHAHAQSPSQRHDNQFWNDTQVAIGLSKKVDAIVQGTLRIGTDISRPVDERIGFGFSIKALKWLTLTPAYYYIATQPFENTKAFEHRLAFGVTIKGPIGRGFVLGDRSIFERRLRHPQIDSTRYRNRLQVEHPFKVYETKLTWFMSDEIFYDWSLKVWPRNRFAIGVSRTFNKHLTAEIYYLRQNDSHARPGDLNVLGTTLRFHM